MYNYFFNSIQLMRFMYLRSFYSFILGSADAAG